MSTAIQINNGKKPLDPYNAAKMAAFPSNTPFGNLLAAKMSIEQRIDYINLKLSSIYKPFPVSIQGGIIPPLLPQLIDIPVEEVIYLLRRSIDDLISLWSILSDFSKNGMYPSKITADCVGLLCQDIQTVGATHKFYASLGWLNKFNDVTNAYKHSFIQRQLQTLSAREPMVLALVWKKNDTKNTVEYRQLTLTEIVTGFDEFYQSANTWLTNWSKANPDNHQSDQYNL